jgi:transposase-like protein
MSKRRQYSAEFKSKLVLELLKEQKTVTQLATENGISPSMLVRWRDEALSKLSMVFEDSDSSRAAKEKAKQDKLVENLYSQVGRLTTQLNWLKKKAGHLPDED